MCLNLNNIKINILEARIKRLRSEIAFEEDLAEVVGDFERVCKLGTRLGCLEKRLQELKKGQ